ncbi:hypothetical protein HNY73_005607 [Argiope bruennichi]|uniref:WH2 domain-containing protein n=1 Tax=Argiope bruennichi TaxID=94029 RepID=A0A8T0FJH8_ARGBR|nr:hypothetical protein HNY73_005607 [Argiope bruennichi]
MDKRSFKKHSIKEQDSSFREQYNILDEKYTKIKEILKQVLAELRELKLEKQTLITEQEKLVAEIKEKDELLERMQSVSEAVIDEYTALKVKCDLETEAANNAIKRATKYFQENQKLRGNTGHESESAVAGEDTNEILSQEPLLDESISELDVLNNLASELRTEIANLKMQLGKEIEKQNSLKEDFEIAKKLYEQEMRDHNCTKEELRSLQLLQTNSRLEDGDLENYRCRNSIQSNQVEDTNASKRNSENRDDVEKNDSIIAKLESAEAQVSIYKQENGKLLCKIHELESQIQKLNKEVSASDLLPIPPPPPPPPLPPPSFNPIKSLITFIHAGKKSSKTVKKENCENPQQKAMSEMIDAIRKGNIQLKPTPKTAPQSPKEQGEETALGEMKNILASLKKKNSSCEDTKSAELPNSIDFSNQETDENVNIGSDIDDELKSLLRKQSIKIATNKVINDDGEEEGKNSEIPFQEAATSCENQFASNASCDNSHLSPENEKNLEISEEELATTNENLFVDPVLSDKSIISHESEKSLEIPLQESDISDENQFADHFLSKNSRMSAENETSLEIPMKKATSENQIPDSVLSENIGMNIENEISLEFPLQESATESQSANCVFPDDNRKSAEKEKSLEILLQEPATENQLPNHVFSDNDKRITENEKSQGILLWESTTESQPADNVFSDNSRKSAENEKSLEISLQELITSGEKPIADSLLSNSSRLSSGNETIII